MRVVTRAQWLRSPWKNGKGVTYEIGRGQFGQGNDPDGVYHWRLSVAEITEPADFSAFEGYERFLGVIEGAGILLTLPGEAAPKSLPCFGSVVFDGGLAAKARPVNGPTRDINLMVLRAWARFEAEITERPTKMLKPDPAAAVNLFVCLRGSAQTHTLEHPEQTLQQHDSLLLAGSDSHSELTLLAAANGVIFSARIYGREPL
ncbi:MAG TPA: HutD family protein [Steroidobacteraceae bacterium]